MINRIRQNRVFFFCINSRQWRGIDATPSPQVFSAAIFSVPDGASFAQKKKNGRVMSGHKAMMSQREQGLAICLREIADYCILEDDIDHDEAFLTILGQN